MNKILVKNTIIQLLKNIGVICIHVGFIGILLYFISSQNVIGCIGITLLGIILSIIHDEYRSKKDLKTAIKLAMTFFSKFLLAFLLFIIAASIIIVMCSLVLQYYKITLPIIVISVIVVSIRNVYMSEKSKLNK